MKSIDEDFDDDETIPVNYSRDRQFDLTSLFPFLPLRTQK